MQRSPELRHEGDALLIAVEFLLWGHGFFAGG